MHEPRKFEFIDALRGLAILAVIPVHALTRWIGKLSFSMYLTHFAVLEAFAALGISSRLGGGDVPALLHYLFAVTVTAGVSWVCYRFIERPGIEAGRRLIERREAARQRYGTIGV